MNNKFNCYCKSCGQVVKPNHGKLLKEGSYWKVDCGGYRNNRDRYSDISYRKEYSKSYDRYPRNRGTYVPASYNPLTSFLVGAMFQ